ncbi:MAG: transporter substrate-binding domain-containing protein [Rhodocyclaceae bacterium]
MRKHSVSLLAAVVLTALASTAHADTLDDIKGKGSITCGVLTNSPPFGMQDPQTREPAGYEIDLCRKLAGDLGVKAEIKPVSPQTRIAELLQGRVDVLAAMISYSKERAKQVDFSGAYIAENFYFVTLASSPIKKVDDLEDKRVALVKGSVLEPLTKKRLPEARILSFETSAASFLAVQQGKVAATVFRNSEGKALEHNAGSDIKPLRQLDESLLTMPSGFAMRKDDARLRDRINAFLAKIEANGEGQEVFDKWMGSKSYFKLTRDFKFGQPQESWFEK